MLVVAHPDLPAQRLIMHDGFSCFFARSARELQALPLHELVPIEIAPMCW
jgi:hypothetical protein